MHGGHETGLSRSGAGGAGFLRSEELVESLASFSSPGLFSDTALTKVPNALAQWAYIRIRSGRPARRASAQARAKSSRSWASRADLIDASALASRSRSSV